MRILKILAIAICMGTAWIGNADEKVLKYGDKTYRESDLPVSSQQVIFDTNSQHYAAMKAALENAILDIYLEEQATKKGKSKADVEKELLTVANPTEKETRKFYDENKERIPYPYEQVKGEIERMLTQQERGKKRTQLVEKVMKEKSAQILIKEPVSPKVNLKVADFPAKGKSDAKVTIVEFADYQCPHCRRAAEAFKTVMEKYKDRAQLIFVDFPINPSGISRVVAEGSHCADKQGKFWEYHYKAYDGQPQLTMETPARFAKELGLDEKKFKECMDSGWAKKLVEQGQAEGQRVGVSGTPTLFFNGRKMNVGHDEESLGKAIEAEAKGQS